MFAAAEQSAARARSNNLEGAYPRVIKADQGGKRYMDASQLSGARGDMGTFSFVGQCSLEVRRQAREISPCQRRSSYCDHIHLKGI